MARFLEMPLQPPERPHDALGTPLPLDLARDEQHPGESGQRRASTWQTSFQTAPVGEVMTAMTAGRDGSGRLRAASNRPSACKSRLELFELDREVADARRLDRFDVELERALGLVQVDPPVGDDPQAGLGLERVPDPLVAEPDALELRLLVLEREVGVAGRRDRDPPDLALDPQVAKALVGADE